jgi:hypothetical protein
LVLVISVLNKPQRVLIYYNGDIASYFFYCKSSRLPRPKTSLSSLIVINSNKLLLILFISFLSKIKNREENLSPLPFKN